MWAEKLVGAVGFEPTTSCSQGRRANQAALRPDVDSVDLQKSGYSDTGFFPQAQAFFNFFLTLKLCCAIKCCF